MNFERTIDKEKEINKISNELLENLKFPFPSKGLKAMYEDGRLNKIIPDLDKCFKCKQNNPHHIYNVGDHILCTVDKMSEMTDDKVCLMAALLHDIGKPETIIADTDGIDHFPKHSQISYEKSKEILKNFNFTEEEKNKCLFLIKNHDVYLTLSKTVDKWVNKYGENYIKDLCKMKRADIEAQNPNYQYKEKIQKVKFIEENIAKKITSTSSC